MLFEAVDRSVAVIETNFATDFAALATAKSLTGLTSTVTVYPDVSAAVFSLGRSLPGMGIYTISARTNAMTQGVRDAVVTTVFDYLARMASAELAMQQAKLAVEAVLLTVDRLWGEATVLDAGEQPFGVTVELNAVPVDEKATRYDGRARILVPIFTRDTVS